MTHPIPEEHENQLKNVLSIEDGKELPENVVDIYNAVRRTATRLGGFVSISELILVAMLADVAVPEPPTTFLDDPDVVAGDRVLVKYRNAWKWAQFVKFDMTDKRVLAVVEDGSGETRSFKPTGVRWPRKEELEAIGEH